jgi:hypothetical protein
LARFDLFTIRALGIFRERRAAANLSTRGSPPTGLPGVAYPIASLRGANLLPSRSQSMRPALLFARLAIAVVLLGPGASAGAAEAGTRPNVLLIVGDDIGFGDRGISGSVSQTPTLEGLAERGLL